MFTGIIIRFMFGSVIYLGIAYNTYISTCSYFLYLLHIMQNCCLLLLIFAQSLPFSDEGRSRH